MNFGLRKAMILAAGFGTRLKPLTLTTPKALVQVKGKPLVAHVLERLISFGISDVVINIHHFAGQLENYFKLNDFPLNINLVVEKEILGTGGGIKNASQYLKDSDHFLVHNVDVISGIDLKALFEFHLKHSAFASLAVQRRQTSRPLLIDSENNITGRVSGEKFIRHTQPKGTDSPIAFCGIHVISSEIFTFFPDEKFFDIFTVYFSMLEQGKKILGWDAGNASWKDVGKYEDLNSSLSV